MRLTRGDVFRVRSDGPRLGYPTTDKDVPRIGLEPGTLLRVRKFVRKGRPRFLMLCDVISGKSTGRRIRFDMSVDDDQWLVDGWSLSRLSALEHLALVAP